MQSNRSIRKIITVGARTEGGGFPVRGPFPGAQLSDVDPFLLLDEIGPIVYGPGEAIGAPPHPHRGFETVTYVLEGEIEHRDSMGNRGTLGPGDVQWMTAGAGVLHSEMPTSAFLESGGTAHAFQLWVNLPAHKKWVEPRYQDIGHERVPVVHTEDGLAEGRVIAGSAMGVDAQVETHTPVTLHHWRLRPEAVLDLEVPTSQSAWIYVFEGDLVTAGEAVSEGQMVLYGPGDRLVIGGPLESERTQFLLGAGAPIREPIARMGPFVMNTQKELFEAFRDYQANRLGRIA